MIKHKKNYKKRVKHGARHYNTDNNNVDKSVKPNEIVNDNNIKMPQHAHRTTKPFHDNQTKETIPEVLDSSRDDVIKQSANTAKVLSDVHADRSLNPESQGSTNPSEGVSTLTAPSLSHIAEEKTSSVLEVSGQAEKAPQSQIRQSQKQKYTQQEEEKIENKLPLENESLSKSVMMPWLNYISPYTKAYNEIIKSSMAVSEYWLKLFSPWTKKLD